ncbi:MAG TPA: hypothetical protein VHE30_23645 [Polyangiaceae bacterium]|nr:hypothetical protein [Polyangiaceae bacterium]
MRITSPLSFVFVLAMATSAAAADSGTPDAHVASATDATAPKTDASRGTPSDAASPAVDATTSEDASVSAPDASVKGSGGAPVIFGSGGAAGKIDLDAADSHDGQLRQYFVPDGGGHHASDCGCALATRERMGSPLVVVLGALSLRRLRRRR